MIDHNIKICGEAGQGIQSMTFILAKAFARGGLDVFVNQDFESRIRGGHVFSQIRVRDQPAYAARDGVELLIALNEESIMLHRDEVVKDGVVIFDGDKIETDGREVFFPVPLELIGIEKGGDRITMNSVALGVVTQLFGYDIRLLEEMFNQRFGKKGMDAMNINASRGGAEFTRENFSREFPFAISPKDNGKKMFINGNEALAVGAIAAGCKFMSAYPMTPSTSIIQYLISKAGEFGLVAEQAEDEIAAVNMSIGANYAGVRGMTATSGGGFSLMVEGIGLAGITETPLVVVEAQRPGPATGLPTRTAQGDLLFVLHCSQDEFPRAVYSPGTIEEAFEVIVTAFNTAEKYQMPVIILSDQHLGDSYRTVKPFDLSGVEIDRGNLLSDEEVRSLKGDYKRHRFTPSGISPRAIPSQKGIVTVTGGDEHDEVGHIIEDADTRKKMMLKRLGKLREAAKEVREPTYIGPEDPKVLLVGWGSTYGVMKEVVSEEKGIAMLHLSQLWPFPVSTVSKAMDGAGVSMTVEGNATGQLAQFIKAQTGRSSKGSILKFDGRPFSVDEVRAEVEKSW